MEAYRTLGLEQGADQDAVRRAYREQIKEVHPDRGGDEAEFRRIKRAYERLREPTG
jgi:curved DNA-binding protein CbpA